MEFIEGDSVDISNEEHMNDLRRRCRRNKSFVCGILSAIITFIVSTLLYFYLPLLPGSLRVLMSVSLGVLIGMYITINYV